MSSASMSFFSSMALPICTAPELTVSLSSCSSWLEKVAPWIPSRPVRPPATTTRSPGRTDFSSRSAGSRPTLPQ
jgi:hypothetical protein